MVDSPPKQILDCFENSPTLSTPCVRRLASSFLLKLSRKRLNVCSIAIQHLTFVCPWQIPSKLKEKEAETPSVIGNFVHVGFYMQHHACRMAVVQTRGMEENLITSGSIFGKHIFGNRSRFLGNPAIASRIVQKENGPSRKAFVQTPKFQTFGL